VDKVIAQHCILFFLYLYTRYFENRSPNSKSIFYSLQRWKKLYRGFRNASFSKLHKHFYT